MQVEISPETERRLRALAERGLYPTLQAALEGVVAEVAQQEAESEAELTRKLDQSRASIRDGRGTQLTRDLAEQLKREARAERDARMVR